MKNCGFPFTVGNMITSSPATHLVAVASGKGGVGKTTTSVNLALSYSRKGIETLLIDADPLADVATQLGLSTPEEEMRAESGGVPRKIFSHFDLIRLKRGRHLEDNSPGQFEECLKNYRSNYKIVVVDLPAGVLEDVGWGFMEEVDTLLVVTNDEPTSHVASGGLIRRALLEVPGLSIRIWHNKYGGIDSAGFDPKDLVGNYNSNVPVEERLSPADLSLGDIAFVPKDPTMDLLQATPDPVQYAIHKMLECTELLYRGRIDQSFSTISISPRLEPILKNLIFALNDIPEMEETLSYIGEGIISILGGRLFEGSGNSTTIGGARIFSHEERCALERAVSLIKQDDLCKLIRATRRVMETTLGEMEESGRIFAGKGRNEGFRKLDRSVGQLLVILSEKCRSPNPVLRKIGGILLANFTLYKMFGSKTVTALIQRFLPWKRDARGRLRRDKRKQISWLVESDPVYRKRYLTLLHILSPAMLKQLGIISDSLGLEKLIFQGNGKVSGETYIKILTSSLHDVVNSGLGIIIGFRYRPASIAFQRGADRLWGELESVSATSDTPEEVVK